MTRRLTPGWRIRATVAVVAFPIAMHAVSLDRINRWILARPSRRGEDVDDLALALWVDRVLHRLPPPWRHTCLKRALTLHYLLHRAGRPAELRIGVRRDMHGALAAHAWLVRGEVLCLEPNASQPADYQVLATFVGTPEPIR